MIKIRGKEFSEETIVKALEAHCNFKGEKKPYIFQLGDVVKNESGEYRIIIWEFTIGLVSYDLHGKQMSAGQDEFEEWGYKKVGTLTDFIKGESK